MIPADKTELSVHLDDHAVDKTVACLRRFGDSVLEGLVNGTAMPTRMDLFLEAIRRDGLVGGWAMSSGDLEKDWKLYTQARTEPDRIRQRESPEQIAQFQRKITAEIRRQQWQGLTLAFPWAFWDSLGRLAWGMPEFQLKYAHAIQSILRDRYVFTEQESRQAPILSPNTFWLLLSLSPIGALKPGTEPPKSIWTRLWEALTRIVRREPEADPLDLAEYEAMEEIGLVAKYLAERPGWAGFWDQWFLGEIYDRRLNPLALGKAGLQTYVNCFPVFVQDAMVAEPSTVKASIPIPAADLRKTVPEWHEYSLSHV